MKKALAVVAVLIVVAVAALLAAPFLIPVDTYKAQLVARVEAATGRTFRIDGPVRLSLLPRLEIEAEDVALGNSPGGVAKNMAELSKLQLRLRILPLLSGEVAVDSFVLVQPRIALEIDKRGRPNWDFAGAGQPARPASRPGSRASSHGVSLGDVRLGDVRLVNGTVSYADARTGKKQVLSGINVAIKLPNLDAPLSIAGDAVWNGKQATFALEAAKPRALLAGEPTPVSLSLAADPLKLGFKGSFGAARTEGDVDLASPSLRGLAAWTGAALPPGEGFGALSITGKLAHAGSRTSFSGARLSLDRIEATGDFSVDTGGARPKLVARLAVERLDLNPYLPAESATPAPGNPSGSPAGGSAAPGGWSETPIDFSPLHLADADLTLSAGSIAVRKIEIGKSVLGVRLDGGRLAVDLKEMALYGGTGHGSVVVDDRAKLPHVQAAFDLDKVDAEKLLHDAAAFDTLSGKAAFRFNLAGDGRSQRAIVETLRGKGDMAFTDGAINGIDLAQMVRNIASATQPGSGGKTAFSELSGTFVVDKGILHNDDLQLKSPLLRVTGAGTVELPPRTVHYRVVPKLAATFKGQGGQSDVAGLGIPVLVEGPWSNLSYRPDLASIARDPSRALKGLEALPKGLLDPAKPGTAPQGTAPSAKPNPLDALKGLFGQTPK
jgi:AsmA protein